MCEKHDYSDDLIEQITFSSTKLLLSFIYRHGKAIHISYTKSLEIVLEIKGV